MYSEVNSMYSFYQIHCFAFHMIWLCLFYEYSMRLFLMNTFGMPIGLGLLHLVCFKYNMHSLGYRKKVNIMVHCLKYTMSKRVLEQTQAKHSWMEGNWQGCWCYNTLYSNKLTCWAILVWGGASWSITAAYISIAEAFSQLAYGNDTCRFIPLCYFSVYLCLRIPLDVRRKRDYLGDGESRDTELYSHALTHSPTLYYMSGTWSNTGRKRGACAKLYLNAIIGVLL